MSNDDRELAERITENEVDAIFAIAFETSSEFCDLVRKQLGLEGSGVAERVSRQVRHYSDAGTIDLDVVLSGRRFLIENKISAYWSFTRMGEAQPDRYERSANGYRALSVLIAPRTYLGGAKSETFGARLSYEGLLSAFSGEQYDRLCAAIRQAIVPPENPDYARTVFFHETSSLMQRVAPTIWMKTRDRNRDSYTVHLDVPRSVSLHPDLPRPKIFLQFREANVKLMIAKWGWSVERLRAHGGLEDTGIKLLRVGKTGTLGLRLPTPFVDCTKPFETQREKVAEALVTTARLCRWWDENPEILRSWQEVVWPA